jgi:protein-tyrosine-phosphatase
MGNICRSPSAEAVLRELARRDSSIAPCCGGFPRARSMKGRYLRRVAARAQAKKSPRNET